MPNILRPDRNCCKIKDVCSPGIIVDARDYYRSFFHAALKAERHIIISGWQFDSETGLLRGKDAADAPAPPGFLKFLNTLCDRNPELRIYILSWDFSVVFALEREWIQEWTFNWSTNERVLFRFDDRHAIGGSQHQKFIVIDGVAAYLGGMDICAGRWDDRAHAASNPLRTDNGGGAYGPYHDVQAFFTGPLVEDISAIFVKRWRDVTGTEISLPPVGPASAHGYIEAKTRYIPIEASKAALSRTEPRTLKALRSSVREIRRLYIDAINAARSCIYIENQYFSSQAIFQALVRRMEDKGRPGIDVVIILPKGPHRFVEEVSIGINQTRLLRSLDAVAKKGASRLGVYYTSAFTANGEEAPVFIHSKLMAVDDRFLTIGSANATNRSMGLDNELNISFEAGPGDDALSRSLRRLRLDLLSEHSCLKKSELGSIGDNGGLVGLLDRAAGNPAYRLQRHRALKTSDKSGEWIKSLDRMIFDPEKAVIEENIFEILPPDVNSLFAAGITLLREWLRRRKKAG